MGSSNDAHYRSLAVGYGTGASSQAGASGAVIFGASLMGESDTVTLGRSNETSTSPDTAVVISSGSSETERGNAMEIREGGQIIIN